MRLVAELHKILRLIAIILGINWAISCISYPDFNAGLLETNILTQTAAENQVELCAAQLFGDSCDPIYSLNNNLRAFTERIVGIGRGAEWLCGAQRGPESLCRINKQLKHDRETSTFQRSNL